MDTVEGKTMRTIILLMSMVPMLIGCAASSAPRYSSEEWTKITSVDFPEKSSKEILEAAAKVLKLTNAKGVSTYVSPDRLMGERKYSVSTFSPLLPGVRGSYDFDLRTESDKTGTTAILKIVHSKMGGSKAVTPADSGSYSMPGPATGPGQVFESPGAYRFFFDRMRSVLYGGPWITCEAARTSHKYGAPEEIDPLCLSADDHTP